MVKKILCGFYIFLLAVALVPSNNVSAAATAKDDFRAVWVSSVINLDFPSKKGLATNELKKEIDSIIQNTAKLGLNAIILQVRPAGDALYKSDIFPWSEYISGTQGVAPKDGFDPLAYWVQQAHKNGLELHAWINPYRITHTTAKITDTSKLSANNPARKSPSRAVAYKDALYYDPGLPENKKLVIDGVAEIVKNYDVDGIHLDDYFYLGTDFPDNASYTKYGAGKTKDDWRRENVNDVIKGIQKVIKELKPAVRFGVSPFAIWQNVSSSSLGSDTRGAESYKTMYADTRRWVKEGWMDYICPQIYWYSGYEIADYKKVLGWWANVCKGTEVDLYVGHAAYKEADNTANWEGEILRQLKYNKTTYPDIVKGSVFFRYNFLKGPLGEQIKSYYTNKNTDKNALTASSASNKIMMTAAVITAKLSVAQPSKDVSTTESGYNIFGTSDPAKQLYMNGQAVSNRTAEGFFSIYVKLVKGANVFTFTQEGQNKVVRTITLKDPAVAATPTMNAAAITSPFPSEDEYVSVGDTMMFKCTAPVSAQVSVKFNGTTLNLTDNNLTQNAKLDNKKIYSTTYSCVYKIPASGSPAPIIELGKPEYSMTYNGKPYSALGAPIKLINKNAPYYATVTANATWAFTSPSTSNGSDWMLLKGQKDAIVAITKDGNWVKLAMGIWVERENVSCVLEGSKANAILTNGTYTKGGNTDVIKWKTSQYPAAHVTYDGNELKIYFALQGGVPYIALSKDDVPSKTVFKSMSSGIENGVPYYTFTVKDGTRIEGYYVSFSNGEFSLNIKKPRTLKAGDKPLSGFTFVIDAGHGQSDSGAVGPMGAAFAEKDINLINATKLSDKLTKLGATVVKVRSTDVFYTLLERTEISRTANPDMFISIHANSVAETTDATSIRGISLWYRNPNSKPLSDHLISKLFNINPLTTRRMLSNQASFYVCRPTWCPSVIIETSFICNIEDFSWLINSAKQDELAEAAANAILSYYGK